ncbi:hypothetical protein QP027_09985 [Corynebacterium breve]|uniref:Secreted protein n=1 Tax=Corynebacterium breve TaxID=3049799 RepID=A0ABY8VDL2_9CORY|nr:hypothetical protein [Corynebacterium breve]WIM67422.1 hypothetical protein QP027_09985 [Corynebacterium breve]
MNTRKRGARRINAVVATVCAFFVTSFVAGVPGANAQEGEDAPKPGWNILGEESFPKMKPRAEANITTETLKAGDRTSYGFSFYPGMPSPADDEGNWTAQTWTTLIMCEDEDVPFDRPPTEADVTVQGGQVGQVKVIPGRTPGCWVFLMGEAWSLEDGMTFNNPRNRSFKDFGFPFTPVAFDPPSKVSVSVPATVQPGAKSFDAEASVEVGRIVDRGIESTDSSEGNFVVEAENEDGLCTYQTHEKVWLESPGSTGVWVARADLTSKQVEPSATWAAEGKTWEDLGRALKSTITVHREDGTTETREATPEQLMPRLENPSGGHVPTQRVLVEHVLTPTSAFSSDLWMGPNDMAEVTIVYTNLCWPGAKPGEPLLNTVEATEPAVTFASTVSRPAEIAMAKANISVEVS